MKSRIREHTWMTKDNIIRTKLMPYFDKKKRSEIQTKDVIAWRNEPQKTKQKSLVYVWIK